MRIHLKEKIQIIVGKDEHAATSISMAETDAETNRGRRQAVDEAGA
jgi:hypothetical protein